MNIDDEYHATVADGGQTIVGDGGSGAAYVSFN